MGFLNSCIMPEMPYCPCCQYGLIIEEYPFPFNEFNDWVCLLPTDRETFENYIMDRFMRVD